MKANDYNDRYLREPRTEAGKREHRQRTMEGIAVDAAHLASLKLQIEIGNTKDKIILNKQALVAGLARYWGLVKWFKDDQDFKYRGRINCPKKAALTIYAMVTIKSPLFVVEPDGGNDSYPNAAFILFASCVMDMFLDAKVNKIPDRHFKDMGLVLTNIRANSASLTIPIMRQQLLALCLYMDAFWTARGKSDHPNGD